MNRADVHPEHDRTSCDDKGTQNADAEGSTGCARCTAIRLDRDARTRELLEDYVQRIGGVSCPESLHQRDKALEHALDLIEDLLTTHALYESEDDDE